MTSRILNPLLPAKCPLRAPVPEPNPCVRRTSPTTAGLTSLIPFLFFFLLGHARALDPNGEELELTQLILQHSGQSRAALVHDPILHMVARHRAQNLGKRNCSSHVDPDGYGPNETLLAAGYGLPSWWLPQMTLDSNTVESLGLGYGGRPEAIFDSWMKSASHRRHVLGESLFFLDQTHFGVGYAHIPGSDHEHYFVFISAPPNEAPLQGLEPYNEWLFTHHNVAEIRETSDEDNPDGDGMGRWMEFVINGDPRRQDPPPPPPVRRDAYRFEWRVPIREDLGSFRVYAEISHNLIEWKRESPQLGDQGFVIERQHG